MSKFYSREQVLKDLMAEDEKIVYQALVAIAFCDEDWQWAQDTFLKCLQNNHLNIKGFAAIFLGHIARIHGKLDKEKVIPVYWKYLDDKEIKGDILDALDDISTFIKS